MSTIGTTSLFLGLVNLNVGNEESIHIQTFHLPKEELVTQIQKKKKCDKNLDVTINFTSALLSAFLSKSKMNLADLTGQRPCPFECRFFAWAVLPTPPQNRVKGMACLWASTSSKYLLALPRGSFLMACAVSLVFYITKCQKLRYDITMSRFHHTCTNQYQVFI